VKYGQLVAMIVGIHASAQVAGFHGTSADDQGNFHFRVPETLQFICKAAAFIAAGTVFENRFIGRWVYGENGIGDMLTSFKGKVTQKIPTASRGVVQHKKKQGKLLSAIFPASIFLFT
jgi:hypothetical protein